MKKRRGPASVESILGVQLYVEPSVLNPALLPAGALLAEAVLAEIRPGSTVLDLGCGSGIVGLSAAKAGAVVVSSDLNPAAVRSTQVGAMLNGLGLEVLEGDLYSAVEGRRFDVVAFNPPFFERAQGGALAMALADGPGLPLFIRFLHRLPDHLTPHGIALIAGSTNGALGRMRSLYASAGLTHRVVRSAERLSERLVVDRLTR
jgi:HemK-related putative methylase